jgi:hypothetical protein
MLSFMGESSRRIVLKSSSPEGELDLKVEDGM